MNTAMATVLVGLVGIVTTLISWVFFAGKASRSHEDLAERVLENRRVSDAAAAEHKIWLEAHDRRLGEHDVELATNRGFREGFKAASKA